MSLTKSRIALLPVMAIAVLLCSRHSLHSQELESITPLQPQTTLSPPLPANRRSARPVSIPIPMYRIKDITSIAGDRYNYVSGLGLVVGLSQTGGRSIQTQQLAENYFRVQGVAIPGPETRAMSAVQVTGRIPPYTKKGEEFQVSVSVIDDATSLRGGVLIRAPLTGLDGQIYAIAQGQILGSGLAAGGAAANVQRDHPTVAVCNAIVEREICGDQDLFTNQLKLNLRNKEHSTAVAIANALNRVFPNSARAIDYGTVEIKIPNTFLPRKTDFISIIGRLEVPVDPTARVVINQKTGTIIMGKNVKILPVVYANGELLIQTTETPIVSQPAPLSQGETVVLPRTDLSVQETGSPFAQLGGGTTVGDLARALNASSIAPNAMIELFTSLKSSGALQAELIIE